MLTYPYSSYFGYPFVTQVVWASTTHVGCAASTGKTHDAQHDWNATWFACDFSYGNMVDSPVYEAGPAASKCKTGENPNYKGLCNIGETYTN